MKKKEYIMGFALGILVFCIVYFSYRLPEDGMLTQNSVVSSTDFCNQILDEWTRGECLALIGGQSESYCETAYEGFLKGQCYIDYAVARKDAGVCEKAGETKDSCLLSLALETSNPTYCGSIGDGSAKSMCLRNIAQDTKDYTLCEKITDSNVKMQCEAENPVALEGCINESTDYCLMNDAVISNDPVKCSQIEESGIRTRCLLLVASNTAGCDSITSPDTRNFCLEVVAEKTSDERPCNSITEQTRKDECYLYAAEAKNDPSLCELIGSSATSGVNSKRNYCYYHLGIINKDAGVCNIVRISSQTMRQSDLCYFHAALRMENMDREKSYSVM